MLRALPGTSRRLGPPRRIASTLKGYVADYRATKVDGNETSYVGLRDAETVNRMPPQGTEPDIHPEYYREMTRVLPATGVATIRNGRVLTSTGTIIGPDDCLVAEVSQTFLTDDPGVHPVFFRLRLPRIRYVDGAVAVLTNFRSNIYYHWLFDTLPRYQILRDSGLPYDWLVVPTNARFQKEALALLPIDPQRIINDPDAHIEAETLLVPTLPGTSGNAPIWACDFIRRSFLPHAYRPGPSRGRRIYISRERSGTRRILNEQELVEALEREGFERVFPEELPFVEQVRLFHEAEIVIGAHGSGLTNLVFCREATPVIELFSPNYVAVSYWALCNQLKLDYHYVVGEGGRHRLAGRGRVHEDIIVNPAKVKSVLSSLSPTNAVFGAEVARSELLV
jgi:hypothetical protein